MIQKYLAQWMNWYYGNGSYPHKIEQNMSREEYIEATKKKQLIKDIVGKPED